MSEASLMSSTFEALTNSYGDITTRFILRAVLKIAKAFGFALLCRDANKHEGKIEGVSWKTVAGLTVSTVISLHHLPKKHSSLMFKQWLLQFLSASACTVAVYKKSAVSGWQDDVLGHRVANVHPVLRHLTPYLMAGIMAVIACVIACKFSVSNLVMWLGENTQRFTCTYENYLNGTVLLPQLMVSRRDAYVSPMMARFLLIFGVLHIYELVTDLQVSWAHFLVGTLDWHEVSYMSGDIFAAAILLDFLYLAVVHKHGKSIIMRAAGLPLPV